MDLVDIIIIIVLALIVGSALLYIIINKKRGAGCIGCPDGARCKKHGYSCKAKQDK